VVFFNEQAWSFKRKLVPSSRANVKAAARFIRSIRVGGRTNLEAGILAAIRDQSVEEVILLSDGAPTGRVRTVNAVLELLGERKIRFHTIGPQETTAFMSELARRTGGRRGILR
jgi:uncharacterized protein with von Willebrand factor type A (vWA) domain